MRSKLLQLTDELIGGLYFHPFLPLLFPSLFLHFLPPSISVFVQFFFLHSRWLIELFDDLHELVQHPSQLFNLHLLCVEKSEGVHFRAGDQLIAFRHSCVVPLIIFRPPLLLQFQRLLCHQRTHHPLISHLR
ncbi:hypothetical protein PMAYCL1PPCAC_31583 [Pristionchus mayeri]|uniref:Uncharacterized protein n=1 Tax=Pristionchus mayeri TaxID=1317129 RepID=A0AAN5DDX9_9BILA|nr:hypothetical protein PMAYCL1PPCAC_31583 [Pristionchus mayeri]